VNRLSQMNLISTTLAAVSFLVAWTGTAAGQVPTLRQGGPVGSSSKAARASNAPRARPPLPATVQAPKVASGIRESPVSAALRISPATKSPPAAAPLVGKSSSGSTASKSVSRSIAVVSSQANQKALQAIGQIVGGRRLAPRIATLQYRNGWESVFLSGRDLPEVRQQLFGISTAARAFLADSPSLFRRPTRLGDIAPSQLDSRVRVAGRNAEIFGLAMADSAQAHYVRTRGVSLAIAAVYANDADCLARSIEILREMCTHSPLQRPGWTAYFPEQTLPPGGDGVWLATGWGITGIVDMLSILGDRVPADLQSELSTLLRREVLQIASDWADRRPWYVRSRVAQSNQWIEPSVGLARAVLYLRDPDLESAYELAAENLSASLSMQGVDGAFKEGFGYGMMSVGSLLDAVSDMRTAGDARLLTEGFAANSWRWMLQNQMPGRRYVNSFDAGSGILPDWALSSPMPAMVSAARASGDPEAISALSFLFPKAAPTIEGVLFSAARGAVRQASMPLPTFAQFPSQAQVMWRSAWEPPSSRQTAFGVWVRGGTATDSHCHRDQGQVSAYLGEQCILMDCGTPDYATPMFEQRFASAAGHGILQFAERTPRGIAVDAPLQVLHLDQDGARVRVDTTKAYLPIVTRATREITWDRSATIEIIDELGLGSAVGGDPELYRIHTGCRGQLQLRNEGEVWIASWPAATIVIQGDRELGVTQSMWPDGSQAGSEHAAIHIRVKSSTASLRLVTKVQIAQTSP
jgi:hypothetical protein